MKQYETPSVQIMALTAAKPMAAEWDNLLPISSLVQP
jgi:hypothetical protein